VDVGPFVVAHAQTTELNEASERPFPRVISAVGARKPAGTVAARVCRAAAELHRQEQGLLRIVTIGAGQVERERWPNLRFSVASPYSQGVVYQRLSTTTTPAFSTTLVVSMLWMPSSGLPWTSTMSASLPGSSVPS
jgi:hypothetical protein